MISRNSLSWLCAFLLLAPGLVADGHTWGRQCDEPATTILQMSQSGIDREQFLIIDNAEDWCEFWNEAHSIIFPAPPCDTTSIDFDREVALAVTMGARPNSCYGIGIRCVQALGASDNIRAHVTETVPGENCNCLPVIVRPVHVVKVDRPLKQVQTRQRTDILDCP